MTGFVDRSRDLGLPDWGPYSKRHPGVAHVADTEKGLRFDVALTPAFFRRPIQASDALAPNGFHPWTATADLSYYRYRFDLGPGERLHCDISVIALADDSRLIECEFVNEGGVDEQVVAHATAYLDVARLGPHGPALRRARLHGPSAARWVSALDYVEISYDITRRGGRLTRDGLLLGEERTQDSVDGSVIGAGFGARAGDEVAYQIERGPTEQIWMRCRVDADRTAKLVINGIEVRVDGVGAMTLLPLPCDVGTPLRIVATGGAAIDIDGFLIGSESELKQCRFTSTSPSTRATVDAGPTQASALLRYPALDRVYGLAWAGPAGAVVQFEGGDLRPLFAQSKNGPNGVVTPARGVDPHGLHQFIDVSSAPVLVPARSSRLVHGIVVCGSLKRVEKALSAFLAQPHDDHRATVAAGRSRLVADVNPSGRRHEPAVQRLAATVATNVVFPTYLRRSHVRHYTPGRWWDSLYSWDSGFIALGLVPLEPALAQDCVNAYLTDPDDPHSAYIHHGSPVPSQQFAFTELYNTNPSTDLLREFYPRLRNQYDFLVGRHESSTTRLPSGLLNTFDYFYNSGGWDDYPAQAHAHEHGLTSSVAPMVTAGMAILAAKSLTLNAVAQGLDPVEISRYADDINALASAVARCWDPDAGYFGYGRHDGSGDLVGLLRDQDGVNLNMGLDGVYPLIAGVCDPAQRDVLLGRLFHPDHLWTDFGLTTVDQSAPYYSPFGYWNGSVWMAHQWFVWKAMFDLGRPDLARRIADAALDLWTSETTRTGNCWEHFSATTGRGLGWPQFSGLSCPVLNWFAAYYQPGAISTGFDTWTTNRWFNSEKTECAVEILTLNRAEHAAATICLRPGSNYGARLDGQPIETTSSGDGVVHASWPVPSIGLAHRATLSVSAV